jgi:hypothetical protein
MTVHKISIFIGIVEKNEERQRKEREKEREQEF